MQLNEVHNDHEHASVSLKVVLLVFAVILVGALGYFVWDFQNTPDTTDYSTPKITKTETTSEETTEEADPCDFTTVTTTLTPGVTFNTQGGENFSTLVCGYLYTKEGDIGFDVPDIRTLAYIAVTKFKDSGFEDNIKKGIDEGNTVNATVDGAYLLGCGCLEDGELTASPSPVDWIEAADQEKLIASTKTKPVIIKLTYEIHGGSGCSCCSLFEKAEVL